MQSKLVISYVFYRVSVLLLCIDFTLQLFPNSDSDRVIRPFGIRRSSW